MNASVRPAPTPSPARRVLSRITGVRVGASTWVALAAMLSIPAIFVAVTRGTWLLDVGGEDNWIYIKYFAVWADPHPELRLAMDQHYKATRVPWILPGYVAYELLGPAVASYVLPFIVLMAGALVFWVGARRLFGDGVALVSALLLIAYPGFHGSGITRFWNYHGQINLVYYLLAMLCVVIGATSKRPALWYAGAGAAMAACLFTGLTYILVGPAFGVFAIAVHPWICRRRFLTMVGAGIVGGALGTALFGLANALVGGPFFFFWRQVTYSFEWASGQASRGPLSNWFSNWFRLAMWLGMPPLVAIGSVAGAALVWRSNATRNERWIAIGCWAQLLVAWGTLLLGEAFDQHMVVIAYQYQMILGSTAYALAALIWVGIRLERRPIPLLSVVGLVAGLVAAQVWLEPHARDQLRDALDLSRILPVFPSAYWGTALLLVLGGFFLIVALRGRRIVETTVAALILGVGFACSSSAPEAYVRPTVCSYVTSGYRVTQQLILQAAAERIDTRAMAWFDPREVRQRSDGCPPVHMASTFDAIQHGANFRPTVQPMPENLAGARTDFLAAAISNRWSMVLLSTPESAARAEEGFQAWLARSPVKGVARRRQRLEASDGPISVVVQVFELRRP